MEEEVCINCGYATGKAGKCEDSLYFTWAIDGAETGPYCDDCYTAAINGRDNA